MRASPFAAATALLLLGACTAGPDYAGPPALGSVAAPGAQFVRGQQSVQATEPGVASWWTALADPALNDLETRALQASPSVAAAEARVRQARASVRLNRANRLPQASASAIYAHAELPGVDLGGKSSGASDGTSFDFLNLGLTANWELEFAGGQRRSVEAADAQAAAAQASVADAQVQLTADVAQAYVNLRERQQRLVLLGQQRDLQHQALAVAQQRYAAGTTAATPVEQARIALERTGTDIATATTDREIYLDALAMLTGAAPGALDAELAAPAAIPLPPAQVAVGDPGALLQRRPDVRAAERTIAAASARIGVAAAARYPKISFMGILGLGGTKPSELFQFDSLAAIAMPQLSWNFLDFGRNAARVEQAEATRDEAEAKYRQTVLAALRDAEDSLSRFGQQRETVAALARVEASSTRMAALTRQRYAAGVIARTDMLEADRQALAARQALQTATGVLTGSYIAVQKSLGLGWSDGSEAAAVQP
ncbi:MAG: hypothetical protein RLZZ08_219 [Pseudomonadota bacterium]|jgi:NodT family efflux transporter outer membrane factor (OMF) lipoprotein